MLPITRNKSLNLNNLNCVRVVLDFLRISINIINNLIHLPLSLVSALYADDERNYSVTVRMNVFLIICFAIYIEDTYAN